MSYEKGSYEELKKLNKNIEKLTKILIYHLNTISYSEYVSADALLEILLHQSDFEDLGETRDTQHMLNTVYNRKSPKLED